MADATARGLLGSEDHDLLEAMFTNLGVGLALHDPNGVVRRANRAAEQILDLTPEQMQGYDPLDPNRRIIRDDLSDFPPHEYPVQQVIHTGHPVHGVVMGVIGTTNAPTVWILIDADPIVREDGVWALATFMNITEQRAAEQTNRSILRALDEHAIVSMTDAEGTITHANDAFCQLSGYRREELLGRNHRILRSGRHSAEFYADLWTTISSGGIWRGQICNLRKDGSHYWVLATIAPRLAPGGSIAGYISIRTDITAAKAAAEAAEEQARIDPLTGCANRRQFDEYLRDQWTLAAAAGASVAVVMLDVDNFKIYNDTLGHHAGDEALRVLAKALLAAVPADAGLVSRWGGEEFAVVLPGSEPHAASAVAERMLEYVRAAGIPRPEPEATGPLTMSAGVATGRPGSDDGPEDLVANADRCLYLAKDRGRDCVVSIGDA